VRLTTKFTNATGEEVKDIFSGYCLWTLGGYFLPLVGMEFPKDAVGMVPVNGAMADWAVNYDETWVTALHAPYLDSTNYEGRDLHKKMALKPGESFEFESYLQILDRGDLVGVVDLEMKLKGLEPAVIAGEVKTVAGETVETPVVMVKRDGKIYMWAQGAGGRYELRLPEGDYQLLASGQGYGTSQVAQVKAVAGQPSELNFSDVERPGALNLVVTDKASGEPLDAQLVVAEGYTPEVEYLGRKVYFTDLAMDKRGQAVINLAKGGYKLEVKHGADFLAPATVLDLEVAPGEELSLKAEIDVKFDPKADGWYSADFHEHSDILDGNTSPALVSLWQSARGLDISVLTDHDSAANHAALAQNSESRGMPFLPGIELSPSWAHFNIYGQPLGLDLPINVNTATMREIYDAARKMGALIFQVNHPYETYGYYASRDKGKIPGGYIEGYDLVELNSYYIEAHTAQILKDVYALWDAGKKVYLNSGNDYHDAQRDRWVEIREMVKIDGPYTQEKLISSLLGGSHYSTLGPFVYPQDFMFGSEVKVSAEPKELTLKVQSVNPVLEAVLIYNGAELERIKYPDGLTEGEIAFKPAFDKPGWFQLILIGPEEKQVLWTNPAWVVE
jgi:predicted metal-dependent phosphoesterase TrpH